MNVYELVTQRIIDQLEAGVIPWRKPWKGSGGGAPINYVSRKPYRGINLLLLPKDGEWLTFKQAGDAGGHVKAGEEGSMVVFYKRMERVRENGRPDSFPYLQYSTVFHVSQCEGIKSKIVETTVPDTEAEPIEAAQTVLNDYVTRSGVTVKNVEGSGEAYYYPLMDTIVLPVIGQFESAEEYYSVAFHEAAHSTGHPSRLNRDKMMASAFGGGDYSREELVAEIAASMVMNVAGIEQSQTFENSVSYINGWLKRLREDSRAIVTASGKAQKAADLILGIGQEEAV